MARKPPKQPPPIKRRGTIKRPGAKRAAHSVAPGAGAGGPTLATPTVPMPGAKSALELKADAAVRDAYKLYAVQDFRRAKSLLDDVIAHVPGHADAHHLRADVHARGMLDAAAAAADLAAAEAILGPNAETDQRRAALMLRTGDEAGAEAAARACLGHASGASGGHAHANAKASAYETLAKLSAAALSDADDAAMRALAGDESVGVVARRGLFNALGRRAEKAKRYDDAFADFAASAALNDAPYDGPDPGLIDGIRAGYDEAFRDARRGWGVKDARHVFFIGMPRSGSTLIEHALTAHPRVESGGETNAIAQISRLLRDRLALDPPQPSAGFGFLAALSKADAQIGAKRYLPLVEPHFEKKNPLKILDKSLGNFMRAPLLLTLFPNAALLHTYRHPLDTALSAFQQNFTNTAFAARLEWIGRFWRDYCSTMECFEAIMPGRIIHVGHEEVVLDFEPRMRRLTDLIGLPWDDRIARPHENDRMIYTASAGQARRPVNTSSFGRWKRYERHLGPLIEAMGGMAEIERRDAQFRRWSERQFGPPPPALE